MAEMISKIWEKIVSLKNQYLIIVATLILCTYKYIFYNDVQACIDSVKDIIMECIPTVYNFGEKLIEKNIFYNFTKAILDFNTVIIGIMGILFLGVIIAFYIDKNYKYKFRIEKILNVFLKIGISLYNMYIIFFLVDKFIFNESVMFIPDKDDLVRLIPFVVWLTIHLIIIINYINNLINEE